MKRFCATIIAAFMAVTLLTAPAAGQGTARMTRSQYIEKYKDLAIEQMVEYGIPASITLAQGCLESADGNSTLARQANNHFGIKCHNNWTGATIKHTDDAPNECFRKYATPEDSFRDHSDFLRYRDRYSSLFALERTDYKGWAYGLKAAGYATSSGYAASLIKIIEDNGLAKYDILTEQTAAELPPTPEEAAASIKINPPKSSPFYTISLFREVREQNGVAYVVANGMENYKSLAKEYNLFHKELLRFNDLKHDSTIPSGTIIYLEKKKKESARHLDKHVVEEGETMYELSQRYAVQLKYLYKYNHMKQGQEPAPGSIINLRNNEKK